MARILIGWELGANTGHAVKLAEIAAELTARGHEPVLAVQQVASAPPGFPVWQAPAWPGQIATLARKATLPPATMGDILAILGLDDIAAMRGLIAAWDNILAAVRPQVVAAEFAPALMLAAMGRWPLLGLGTGFSLPPWRLPRFPSLTGQPAAMDESRLLEGVNRALAANGRPARASLPGIFAADRDLVASFREMDPYREWRVEPHAAPSVAEDIADIEEQGRGDELFVYMNGPTRWRAGFWQGIVDAGLKTRVHDPRMAEADARVLAQAGLVIERAPVPFARIVERSRLVMFHGGMGLASSAILTGLPAVVVPYDIEKRMIAASVAELGLGLRLDYEMADAATLADALRRAHADEGLAARARAAMPAFRARMTRSCAEQTADVIEGMIGRPSGGFREQA